MFDVIKKLCEFEFKENVLQTSGITDLMQYYRSRKSNIQKFKSFELMPKYKTTLNNFSDINCTFKQFTSTPNKIFFQDRKPHLKIDLYSSNSRHVQINISRKKQSFVFNIKYSNLEYNLHSLLNEFDKLFLTKELNFICQQININVGEMINFLTLICTNYNSC